MKTKNIINLITVVSIVFASFGNAVACTSLVIMDASGNGYKGRTLELNMSTPTALTFMPAGTKVESVTPAGKQGMIFETKYPILGMAGKVVPNAKQPLFAEGANDQGLSISMQWFNNAKAPPVGKDDSKILSVNDFSTWILGSFKSVAEAKAALLSDNTEFWLPLVAALSPGPLPQHFGISDKTGASIVVEFSNGKKNVYDNPVTVLTNDPSFQWHLENLNNYTFNNKDRGPNKLGKLTVQATGPGDALQGLPSSGTPAGRFVKAAFYANYVRKAKTPDEAIAVLSHTMNNFDIPYDYTMDYVSDKVGFGPTSKPGSTDVTQWTVMNDLSRNLYYVRSINAINWAVIDMNKLKDVKQMKTISTYDVDRSGADAFTLFYK